MANYVMLTSNLIDYLNHKLFRLRAWCRIRNILNQTVEHPIYILTMTDYRVIVKIIHINRIDVIITETKTNYVLCSDKLIIKGSIHDIDPKNIVDGIRSIYIDVIYHGFRRHKWDGYQKHEDTSLRRVVE